MSSPPQPLFVLGFPRSGTTLLQRLLNSYDDVLIWGEHVGFLADVANAYFRVWRNPDFFKGTRTLDTILEDPQSLTRWQAWMNWIQEDDWRRLYREFLESVFVPRGLPGKRFWGWKEVHYPRGSDDRTLAFLSEVCPDARYAFVVRDGFNTMASFGLRPRRRNVVAWQNDGCRRWRETVQTFRTWHESGRLQSFWIRYEDLIRGEGEILRLLDALGHGFGDDQHAILRGESGRGSSFGSERFDARWETLSALRLGIASACFADVNRELGYPTPPVPFHARAAGRALVPVFSALHLASRVAPRARELLRALRA